MASGACRSRFKALTGRAGVDGCVCASRPSGRGARVSNPSTPEPAMPSRAVITPIQPRGLTRQDAAAYCGLTPEGFDDWVRRGIAPGPIAGTQRWDRKAIDLALDRASGLESAQTQRTSAYD